jgi:hypothetical protein
MATFSAIRRILRDHGTIIVATSELGKMAYKNEVENWHIPDHIHFAAPKTFQRIAARVELNISYVSRLLTQRVILTEKLSYKSEKSIRQMGKVLLRFIPGLADIASGILCLWRGFRYPRHEVVVLFHKGGKGK